MKKSTLLLLAVTLSILTACIDRDSCEQEDCLGFPAALIGIAVYNQNGENAFTTGKNRLKENDFILYNVDSIGGLTKAESYSLRSEGFWVDLNLDFNEFLIVIADTNRYLLKAETELSPYTCFQCRGGTLLSIALSDSIPCVNPNPCSQYYRVVVE